MRRGAVQRAGTVTLLVWVRSASAQVALPGEEPTDIYALPDAPAPPTLPDLTHRGLAASLENAFASIQNATPAGEPTLARSFGWMQRLELEQAL